MSNKQSPTARRRGASAIGRVAAELTSGLFERYGLGRGEIAHAWPQLVGPELARVCRPDRIAPARKGDRHRGGTLHVTVSGAHGVDVHYASTQIISGVNALYGHQVISRVQINQTDDVASPQSAADEQALDRKKRLDQDEHAEGLFETKRYSEIHETDLRLALARLEAGVLADEAGRSDTEPKFATFDTSLSQS